MKLLVGLGNPGSRYAKTRHNIGFMVIEQVAREFPIQQIQSDAAVELHQTTIDQCRVLLLKPQTYMNLSGVAVQRVMQAYDIAPHEIVVAYDDLDLDVGRLRIRKKGGHGGHKGVRSIIEYLGTPNFVRLRMGIGRPDSVMSEVEVSAEVSAETSGGNSIVEFVLQPFTQEEQPIVDRAVKRAAEAIRLIVADRLDAAMNAYNLSIERQKSLDRETEISHGETESRRKDV